MNPNFTRRLLPVVTVVTLAAALHSSRGAAAGSDPGDTGDTGSPTTDTRARAAFKQGTAQVEQAQWAEALAAFERAASMRRHAVTTYNIAACERAMGALHAGAQELRRRAGPERSGRLDGASGQLGDRSAGLPVGD